MNPHKPTPVTETTVTKYCLPNGEEFDSREKAERAFQQAELAQELYECTSADKEASTGVAEYLLDTYTLTPKGN